ncbi:hypothetical protein Syun_026097 [Stephania yunnanensis]|uniref:Uncharacterized protein n=1 Tax=Stephania yunnanensis TaxID=152371 RepID=A0AAP0EVS2_9MAGN
MMARFRMPQPRAQFGGFVHTGCTPTQFVPKEGETESSNDDLVCAFLSQNEIQVREILKQNMLVGDTSAPTFSRALQKELQRLDFKIDYNILDKKGLLEESNDDAKLEYPRPRKS